MCFEQVLKCYIHAILSSSFNEEQIERSDACIALTDKQTEIDLPLLTVEDADAEKTPTKPGGIMAAISGVRRLQLGASSGGELPRYGVEVEDETLLTQVAPSCPPCRTILSTTIYWYMAA